VLGSECDAYSRWCREEVENLCLALRRNDPVVTELENLAYVPNYGPRLVGEALQGNTHAAILELIADNGFLSSEKLDVSPDHVLSLLSFVCQSQSHAQSCFSAREKT
jgi:hypothetical protein